VEWPAGYRTLNTNNMPLTTCPDCSTEVSRSAYSCPKCGRPFRKTPTQWVAWIIAAIVLGIIVFTLAVSGGTWLAS
jgi:uncharacterized paraquat-inducible protein A